MGIVVLVAEAVVPGAGRSHRCSLVQRPARSPRIASWWSKSHFPQLLSDLAWSCFCLALIEQQQQQQQQQQQPRAKRQVAILIPFAASSLFALNFLARLPGRVTGAIRCCDWPAWRQFGASSPGPPLRAVWRKKKDAGAQQNLFGSPRVALAYLLLLFVLFGLVSPQ
ncbi:hypothetical protein ACQKWADRAFT_303344 [Trichoderma austrokoningii]